MTDKKTVPYYTECAEVCSFSKQCKTCHKSKLLQQWCSAVINKICTC